MSNLDELNAVRVKADTAFWEARQRYDKRLLELQQEAQAKLNAEPIGIEFYAAQEAQRKAYAEWLKEKEANNEAASLNFLVGKGVAVGDVVEEWMPRHYNWDGPFIKTGNKGVIQVYHNGEEMVIGRRHEQINHGDMIVRLLKKDGTQGKKVVKWTQQWVKEGTIHPRGAQS